MSATLSSPGVPLTSSRITELTSNRRQRGAHKAFVRRFVASGDEYIIVNSVPLYRGKNAVQLKGAVKAALETAAKKLVAEDGMELPELQVIFDEEAPYGDTAGTLYLINMEVHAAAVAERDEDDEDDE